MIKSCFLVYSLIATRFTSVRSFSPPSSALYARSINTHSRSALLDMKNPLQSLFQNIQKQGMTALSSQQLLDLAAATSKYSPTSWDEIRTALAAKQTPEEKEFRNNLPRGIGAASPLHKLRLFEEGNKEDDIRVTLFRDSASWCPYCQKVSCILTFMNTISVLCSQSIVYVPHFGRSG